MKQPNSKLPWKYIDVTKRINHRDYEGSYEILAQDNNTITDDQWYYNRAPEPIDAEYIVEACNNYPKAVELLKESMKLLDELYYQEHSIFNEVKEFLGSINEEIS